MNRTQIVAGMLATLLTISANAKSREIRAHKEVNGITYHLSRNTSIRPDNLEPYRGYGVDVTDLEITDGYLKIYARTYQDKPKEVYILGAMQPNDRSLRPLAFQNTRNNLEELFAGQGKKVYFNRQRDYR